MSERQKPVTIEILGNHFALLPEKALIWLERRYLIVADPHFGKAASFRLNGIAVPAGSTRDDLGRLTAVLKTWCPEVLLILGDLLHSASAKTNETKNRVAKWREQWAHLPVILVQGNHDRRSGKPLAEFRIDSIQPTYEVGPFVISHIPPSDHSGYALSGHLHPAVRLSGPGKHREIFPCFHFKKDKALLPAYGSFTGNLVVNPEAGDRVFVVAENEVIPV